MQREYQIKLLREAHSFTLTIQEDTDERVVEDEIVQILEEEYSHVPTDFFRGIYEYYRRVPRSKVIKRHSSSATHKYNGFNLKNLISRVELNKTKF